jgi:hypothetical protein
VSGIGPAGHPNGGDADKGEYTKQRSPPLLMVRTVSALRRSGIRHSGTMSSFGGDGQDRRGVRIDLLEGLSDCVCQRSGLFDLRLNGAGRKGSLL